MNGGTMQQQVDFREEVKEVNYNTTLLDLATKAVESGNRITLLKRTVNNGNEEWKSPLWKGFLDPATNTWNAADIRKQIHWAESKNIELTGYGIINGPMSGNRMVLDFDQGEYLYPCAAKVREETGFDLLSLPRVKSGRKTTGYHLIFRSTESLPKQAIANDEKHGVIVELMGTGCHTVGSGSRHRSGNIYETENGDPLNPPIVNIDTVKRIVEVLKTAFDRTPKKVKAEKPVRVHNAVYPIGIGADERPGDRYNRDATCESVCSLMESYGWSYCRDDKGGIQITRPGKDGGVSGSIGANGGLHVFTSSNDVFKSEESYSPFEIYSRLEHRGDRTAAARALATQYGMNIKRPKGRPDWESDADALIGETKKEDAEEAADQSDLSGLVFETMADVEAKAIDWLWPGRLANGKMTMISGDPGKGKSFLSLDIASRVSTGRPFPDGHKIDPGTVLIITDEDDSEDTIKPRLLAMGADTTKIHRLKAVKVGKTEKGWNLHEVWKLKGALKLWPDLKLIIIDPLMSYLGGGKDYKDNSQMNELLGTLNKFADESRVAILALVHLNKSKGGDALYRSIGSIAFVSKARLAFVVAPDKTNPDLRIVASTKSNSAKEAPSIAYRIIPATVKGSDGRDIETARVIWEEGTVDVTADDLLGGSDGTQMDQADTFLRQTLTEPMLTKDLKDRADSLGISYKSLYRASEKMGVKRRKIGMDKWVWEPPTVQPEPPPSASDNPDDALVWK